MRMKHRGTGTQKFLLLCVSLSLWFMISSCARQPSAPRGEVTEVRIPRGAGGVGFLPLLVMEKYSLIEEQAKSAGIQGVPFFIFDDAYAVSGAQAAEQLAGVIRKAAGEKVKKAAS